MVFALDVLQYAGRKRYLKQSTRLVQQPNRLDTVKKQNTNYRKARNVGKQGQQKETDSEEKGTEIFKRTGSIPCWTKAYMHLGSVGESMMHARANNSNH